MAIKGKKKSQKTRAKRPSAPKPVIVVPQKPFLARRWVQVTAVAIIALLFGLGFGYGFGKQDRVNETAAAKQNAQAVVKNWASLLDSSMKGVGTYDVGTHAYKAFPSLAADMATITKSSGVDAASVKDAASVIDVAQKAGTALEGSVLSKMMGSKTIPDNVRTDLINSQKRLTQALALYVHAATDLKIASVTTGKSKSESLASAGQLITIAGALISDGYNDYVTSRLDSGVGYDQATKQQLEQQALQNALPSGAPAGIPGTVPGGVPGVVPGGVPGGVPGAGQPTG
jgi:hypothetical protein